MSFKVTISQLAQLAQEAEITDPIDWDYLNIDETTAYKMMAAHVIELPDDCLTLKAIAVKLLVENFVTNLKLEQARGN
jgi:hypothetical protein